MVALGVWSYVRKPVVLSTNAPEPGVVLPDQTVIGGTAIWLLPLVGRDRFTERVEKGIYRSHFTQASDIDLL